MVEGGSQFLDVIHITKDSGIIKKIIKKGEDEQTPEKG